jgi:hypothetical protein
MSHNHNIAMHRLWSAIAACALYDGLQISHGTYHAMTMLAAELASFEMRRFRFACDALASTTALASTKETSDV